MAQRTQPAPRRTPDPSNRFEVAAHGRDIVIMRPPQPAAILDADAAANLAAWIMALLACQPDGGEIFERTLAAVRAR